MSISHESIKKEKHDQIQTQQQSLMQEQQQQDQAQSLHQMPVQQNRQVQIPGAVTMHIQEKDTVRREAVSGRSIARLLADQNTGKDSDAMKNAKNSVAELEALLEQSLQQENMESYIGQLEAAYLKAISYCRYYCDHRNPSFETGIQRKKAVSDELESLLREKAQLDVAKQLVKDGRFDVAEKNGMSLLEAAQETMSQQAGQGESGQQPVQEDPMQKLSFADFTRMLGTHNRGQIEFDGKGLRIINNGKFSMSKGVASERNYDLAQYFKSLVMQELQQAQLPVDDMQNLQLRVAQRLGLSEGQSEIRPISREAVAEIVRVVNDYTSVVDQTLRKGRKAFAEDRMLAAGINEMLSADVPDEHVTRTKAEHEEILRSQITNILNEAKKQGIRVPGLSKHQMDNLVKGNINLVRTKAFQYMRNIYERMCNLNGGRFVDFNKLAADKSLFNRIMAFTIARVSAVSEAGVDVAEHELSVQITEAAFKYSGKSRLKEVFDKSDVRMFSMNGDDGLETCVERTFPQVKEWDREPVRVKKGMDGLADLSRSLRDLHDMKEKAFGEGLTEVEAGALRKLGTHIQNLITGQEQGAPTMMDMEFVSKQLTGTRYQEGFEYVKNLSKDFSFADAAEQIAAATTYREKNAEEKKLHEPYGDQQPDDVPQPLQTAETEQLLGKLSGQERSVAEILLMMKTPSGLVKENGDSISQDLVKLRYALNSFMGGIAHAENLTVAGVNVRLIQKERGAFEVQLGRQKIRTPYSPALLAAKIDVDISKNVDAYGEKVVGEVLSDAISSVDQNLGEQKAMMNRTLFLNVLCHKTKLPAARFNNVSSVQLAEMTKNLLSGSMTDSDVTSELQRLSEAKKDQLNEQDILDMLRLMEEKEKLKQEKTVFFRPQEKEEKKEGPEEAKWTASEEELKDLVADLIFSKDTWKTDTERNTSAERIKALLRQHTLLLARVIYDPNILNNMLDKLYLPGAENLVETLKGQINEVIHSKMIEELKERCGTLGMLKMLPLLTMALGKEQPSEAMLKMLNLEEEWPKIAQNITTLLTNLDQEIATQVKTQVGTIQSSITDAVGTVFSAKEEQEEKELPDDNVGPEPEKLSVILENAAKGKQGQGKFMRIVLSNYFRDADLMDQRAMLAGALRDLKPVNVKPGEEMDEKVKDAQMGHLLGGFLKGAGPLMHKMLQGLPTESMPEILKSAVADMKSNLAPIPQKIVEARLNKIVDSSHGLITKIEVTRSMGAASVGQVFLCKLFGPGMAEDGKDVVIKLLRPDVSNHMEREKVHMLKYAQETDEQGGMLATYKGQLERIEEELDLRIEAKNVKLGEVYDQGTKRVQSVKLNDLVEPDVNTLVMEKASGTTVDKYLKETGDERRKLLEALETAGDGGYEILAKLDQMLDGMIKRQKYLTEVARKWIASGLYNEGFYHGDLHAGNIMVSEEGATVIDFGNATQITEEQRMHIMHMLCSASIGHVDNFRHHFHMLMSQSSEEAYQKNRKAFGEMLEEVLNREDMSHAGERIAVALLKAQELGLELPGAVFNFSQCQLRLQNTIADMNKMIDSLKKDIGDLLLKHEPKTDQISAVGALKAQINEHLSRLNQGGAASPDKSLEINLKSYMDLNSHKRLDRKTILEYALDDNRFDIDSGIASYIRMCVIGKINPVFLSENGKEPINAFINILLNACDENEKEVREALEDLQKRLNTELNRPKGEKDMAKIVALVEELLRCKKGRLAEAYLASRDQYKKLKEQSVSEEDLKKAEDQLVNDALHINERVNKHDGNIQGVLSGMVLKLHADDQTAFQQEMKDWFDDQDNGEVLKDAYNDYVESRKSGTEEEQAQAENNFFEAFEQMVRGRAELFLNVYEKQRRMRKPNDFFDVMGEIMTDRRTETVSKLGIFSTFTYRKIRKGKNLVQISPLRAAWQKRQEGLFVVMDLQSIVRSLNGIMEAHKAGPQENQTKEQLWDSIREELSYKANNINVAGVTQDKYVSSSKADRWINLLEKAGEEENIDLVQRVVNEVKDLIEDVKRKTGFKDKEDLQAERDQAQREREQREQAQNDQQ